MSLIFKGIDLPNSGQIELTIRPHGKVFSNTKGISAEAIQIPKDHGRLIDADEFKATLMKQLEMAKANYQGDKYERIKEIMEFIFNNLYKDIDNAPTILEAEE